MEGLGNGQRGTYLQVTKGKFCIKVDADTPNAVKRINQDGGSSYYLEFSELTGVITGFATRQKEYQGKEYVELLINVQAGSTKYIVPVSTQSGYYRSLCMQIFSESFDLSKPVNISLTYKEEGGIKKSGLFVNQNGKGVEKFMYTRDNPLDAPKIEEITNKSGKLMGYDSAERDVFFINKFNALNSSLLTPSAAELIHSPDQEDGPQADDNLPF